MSPLTSTASDHWQARSAENALRSDSAYSLARVRFAKPYLNVQPSIQAPVRNPDYWKEWNAWRMNQNAPSPRAFL